MSKKRTSPKRKIKKSIFKSKNKNSSKANDLEKYLVNHYSKGLLEIKEDIILDWKNLDDKLFRQKKKHLIVKDFREKQFEHLTLIY